MTEIDDPGPAGLGFTKKRRSYVGGGRIGLNKVDIVSERRMFGNPASAFKFEFMTSELIVGESCAA